MRKPFSIVTLVAAGALVLAVSSCNGGGGHGTNATTFVNGLIADTSDTGEPVPVNGVDLHFSDDPAAFDALFQ